MQLISPQKTNMAQKIADIEEAAARYVLANCNCNIFSDQYVTQGVLVCGNNQKEFIFEARVLSTGEKTSGEFRDDLLQKWVKEEPIVSIAKQNYQIDPYCTVELSELMGTECRSDFPTAAASRNSTKTPFRLALEITAGVGGGVGLCILIAAAAGIACCCCSRKSVKRKYHEPHREGLDIQ